VAELAALADRFQASGVAKACALHLASGAIEIPYLERLLIAQRFRLAGVCVSVFSFSLRPTDFRTCGTEKIDGPVPFEKFSIMVRSPLKNFLLWSGPL
jgi:hypothetical protein